MIGLFEYGFRLFAARTGRFHHHATGPVHQLDVGGLHIHHQVLIHLAELHHRAGGDHIEHQFLRGPGFETRGAGERFGPDDRRNSDVGHLRNGRAWITGDSHGSAARLIGIFQTTNDVRCAPGSSQPDHQIVCVEVKPFQVIFIELFVVFRPFYRLQQRARPTGNETDHQPVRNAERRRTFRGIQHAESSAGSGAHINNAAPRLERLCRSIDGLRHLW